MRDNKIAARRVKKNQTGGQRPPTIVSGPFGDRVYPSPVDRFSTVPAGVRPPGDRPRGLRRGASPLRGGRRYVGNNKRSSAWARPMQRAYSLKRRY
jgi:hypothetical protein